MADIRYFQQLHHKSVLGEPLTPDEQKELTAWYVEMEQVEANILGVSDESQRVDKLQAQIDDTLKEMQLVTTRIRELMAENEVLRRELAQLKQQLAHTPTSTLA